MLGSLVVFLLASLIVGYVMKASQERDSRARKLRKIKQKLTEKEEAHTRVKAEDSQANEGINEVI